ncbi:MAG TPA: MarR family transcriptional regulator [Glaciibacter sp.]|nr:MarR family transcriptional regulator [Glaciibacter sp.]
MTREEIVGIPRAGRKHLRPEELAVWRSLVDTTEAIHRRLSAILQESDISPADYAVLLALSEANDHELRSSDLAAVMNWERSRLSHHLGRMEKRNLIRRSESALDSRAALVSLTSDGARTFRRVSAPHLQGIKVLFADALTSDQLDSLADILRSIRKHLDD